MFLHEYGLLVAVATPVLVILILQVLLLISGERATLLLPSSVPSKGVDGEQPAGGQNVEVPAGCRGTEPAVDKVKQAA